MSAKLKPGLAEMFEVKNGNFDEYLYNRRHNTQKKLIHLPEIWPSLLTDQNTHF
jgi:hypothetical protein